MKQVAVNARYSIVQNRREKKKKNNELSIYK